MLANDHGAGDLESLVAEWECGVELPCHADEFFSKCGPMPTFGDERRRYQRFYYRYKALLKLSGSLPAFPRPSQIKAVYTRDVSRDGVGFLFDEQIYPTERCLLILPNRLKRSLSVTYCRRLSMKCYEIGATFLPEAAAT